MSIDGRNPATDLDVSPHVKSDPGLKENMLKHGYIYWFMGSWYLTPKGREEFAKRFEHRRRAVAMGVVHSRQSDAKNEELPSNFSLEHDND